MKRTILICVLCLWFFPFSDTFAQKIHYLGKPYFYADSVKVDDSRITVIYRHEYTDTTNNIYLWSNIRIQAGARAIKQVNLHTHFCNYSRMAAAKTEVVPEDIERIDRQGNANPTYFSDIILDKTTGAMQVTCCDYLMSDSSYPWQYTEPVPRQDWVLHEGICRSICGYNCHKATTLFRGRQWDVWYTPDIPIDAGPWKFNGLPGLILSAGDSEGYYTFECIEIRSLTENIYRYTPVNAKVITREKYLRYEKNYYLDPQIIMQGDDAKAFSINDGCVTEVETKYSIPYNPIELE